MYYNNQYMQYPGVTYGQTASPTTNQCPGCSSMMASPSASSYPVLPSGGPTGPAPTPIPANVAPFVKGTSGTTVASPEYTQGFLQTQIGKTVRIEFLIGTNTLVDRIGTLLKVGASYVLLRDFNSDDTILCDLYSIKFVRIYR